MKKLLIAAALLCSPLCALPLGNPMDASLYTHGLFWGGCDPCCDICDPCFSWCDAWSLRLGFYGDYVNDRHMRETVELYAPQLVQSNNLPTEYFAITTNAGLLTLNLCHRLDLFATLGASSIEYEGAFYDTASFGPDGIEKIFTSGSFAWSVGGRLTLWDCDCFHVGIEGQYARSNQNIFCVNRGALLVHGVYDELDNLFLRYSEWQVGLGAAYLIEIGCSGVSLIPYTGVKWAHAKGTWNRIAFINAPGPLSDLKSAREWGWALGITARFCEVATVSVEGRWADESAVSVNGQFRF